MDCTPHGVPSPHPGLARPRIVNLDFPTGGLGAWERQAEEIQVKLSNMVESLDHNLQAMA